MAESKVASPIPPHRRRDKLQLSCTACRGHKQRCDRRQPCQNCKRRNQSGTCTYLHTRNQNLLAARPGRASPNRTILHNKEQEQWQDQLQIASPLSESLSASGGPYSGQLKKTRDLPSEPSLKEHQGRLSIEDDTTTYVGRSHWASVMDKLTDRGVSSPSSVQPRSNPNQKHRGPSLLLGWHTSVTKEDLLGALPPKNVVDRLVSRYFSSVDLGSMMLHGPMFQKEYEKLWENPATISIIWLSILFSLMSLAANFNLLSEERQPEPKEVLRTMVNEFREKAAECLILGEYTDPGPYTVEALVLYYAAEHIRNRDTRFGDGVIYGIVVRTAMRMGYHRDASHYSNISVFDGEMRRRLWLMIVCADILFSSQMGLPKLIDESQTDTALPQNLLDEDFDENTKTLPTPRSDLESTPVSYMIFKSKLVRVFGKIVDRVNSPRPFPYEDVMELDTMLVEVYTSMPQVLQIKIKFSSVVDPAYLILRRYSISLLYQKSRCVLHRKFLFLGLSDKRYSPSRMYCIDAAMKILQYQAILHEESQPGCPLYRESWKLLSNFTHDFLLAAMIISLELKRKISSSLPESTMEDGEVWTQSDLLQAIVTSHKIWTQSSATSKEASQATMTLGVLLEKVGANSFTSLDPPVQRDIGLASSYQVTTEHIPSPPSSVERYDPEATTFTTLPSYQLPTQNDFSNYFSTRFDAIESMMDGEMGLDYGLWQGCLGNYNGLDVQ